MKRTRIKPISNKQQIEIWKRQALRAKLVAEHGDHCMTCNDKHRDWRGISLSHIIPLSRGGKTAEDNVLLECYFCHEFYEKKPELREVQDDR